MQSPTTEFVAGVPLRDISNLNSPRRGFGRAHSGLRPSSEQDRFGKYVSCTRRAGSYTLLLQSCPNSVPNFLEAHNGNERNKSTVSLPYRECRSRSGRLCILFAHVSAQDAAQPAGQPRKRDKQRKRDKDGEEEELPLPQEDRVDYNPQGLNMHVLPPGGPAPRLADGHVDLTGRYYPNSGGRMLDSATPGESTQLRSGNSIPRRRRRRSFPSSLGWPQNT